MRCAWMGVLIAAAAFAQADRIILAPTATKLLQNQFRVEFMSEFRKDDRNQWFVGAGVTKDIEVEFVLDRFDRDVSLGTLNLMFQYVAPLVDTAPGLAVGVQDALDRTRDGRTFYIAFTYRLGLDGAHNSRTPLEISLAGLFGDRSGLSIGVQLPFTWQFRGLFEHDGNRISSGLEYRALPGFAVRGIWRQGETLLGLRYTARF